MVHHRVAIGLGAADQGAQPMGPHSASSTVHLDVGSKPRAFEDDGVMIGWQLDKFSEYEAARFDRLDGLFRRHPQVSLWSPWLAQDCSFLARPLMPVDNGKAPARLQRFVYSLR